MFVITPLFCSIFYQNDNNIFTFSENPASEDDEYRFVLIDSIKSLLRVDKDQIAQEEREEAAEIMKVREADRAAKAVSDK